jgi:thiol-disulfide isomerase/thioredoxin
VLACECVADAGPGNETLNLSLPALRVGEERVELARYRNMIVYVDVWASWCAPCLRSMPELEALQEKFRDQPFAVVAVNVDDDPAAARAFLERVDVHYPVAFDRNGVQLRERIGDEVDLSALPVGFLLDGRGTIRLVHRGYSPGQSAFLADHIQTLLAQLELESNDRR